MSGPIEPDAGAPAPEPQATGERLSGFNLFLVGFLVLFLELACIRWFAAYVVFLQFFSNVVLIASFLGMSCGCLAARRHSDWLARFPFIALPAVAFAPAILALYNRWSGLAITVGSHADPQQVFFGTEYRNPDVARFVVPIDLIAGVFFVLVALMFVGLGQVLGRAFDSYPNRVRGYTLNIGGSLVGILGFSVLSFMQAPPAVWFLVCCAGVAYLLNQSGRLGAVRTLALAAIVVVAIVPTAIFIHRGHDTRWSPYYVVDRDPYNRITVNTIGQQQMVPYETGGSSYSLIHLLQRATGGRPFHDVLVIGAGSGNDLVHTLKFGATRIDAVEIDPAIQGMGIRHHPDHPYQDPRVVRHIDDGRHFLRTTDRKYDLVVYALVDSLILHSSYSNLRLESYLFSQEAIDDVRRVLKPNGIFVTYNFFRQGWIVERVAAMAKKAFGTTPIVLSLPYVATMRPASPAGFVMLICGANARIKDAFKRQGTFWLNEMPAANVNVNGFQVPYAKMSARERVPWQKIAPTTLIHDSGAPMPISDDWPFLYNHGRLIPDLTLRSMVIMGGLGLAMIYFFMPRGEAEFHGRMFFLGAAFMLLETRAVVQMALLFGSTWLVNSLVFFTVLVLILLANLYVLKARPVSLAWHYGGLFLLLLAGVAAPLDIFLAGGLVWRYVVPCVLALGPMLFAGVIFARTFRDTANADQAFGSNIAGSVVGGLSESCSMLLGFRYLLLLAMLFYALSAWAPTWKPRRAS